MSDEEKGDLKTARQQGTLRFPSDDQPILDRVVHVIFMDLITSAEIAPRPLQFEDPSTTPRLTFQLSQAILDRFHLHHCQTTENKQEPAQYDELPPLLDDDDSDDD